MKDQAAGDLPDARNRNQVETVTGVATLFQNMVRSVHKKVHHLIDRFRAFRILLIAMADRVVRALAKARSVSILTCASDPLFFPADAPTDASLPAGPITDLNVMTRRGRARHRVRRLTLAGPADFTTETGTTLVFCHEGSVGIGESAPVVLGARDTLWLDGAGETLRFAPRPHAILFVIAIQND